MPERLPDHVSPDTGRRLREAGLDHEWQIGDWCCDAQDEKPMLYAGTFDGLATAWRPGHEVATVVDDAACRYLTWLPTTGQLLDLHLALQPEGEGCATIIRCSDSTYRVAVAVESSRGMFRYSIMGTSPAEALAEAWLRVKAQGSGA